MANRFQGLLLLLTVSSAAWAGSIEENFEISVPASGAKVETPLPVSELKGSFIVVPRGAVRKRTDFSITSSFHHCPKLPKNVADVAPPMNFGPENLPFLQSLVVRIAIPPTYASRLTPAPKNFKRGTFKSYQIWGHWNKGGWKRVKARSLRPDYVEFSTTKFDGSCYTVARAI
jgi:hypothetical protein